MSNETNVAANETNVAAEPTKPAFVPTSETLTKLQSDFKTAWMGLSTITDPMSVEFKNGQLDLMKIQAAIGAETAALNKAESDRILDEQRNERIQLNRKQFVAYDVLLAVKANKKATPDELSKAQSDFETAQTLVDNELITRFAKSKPATAAASDGTAPAGRNTESKAAILELARAGKTLTEITAAGYPRSTVWHTTNNAKIAGETFPNIK